MEEVISAGGRAESSEGSFEDLDEMEEVRPLKKRMQTSGKNADLPLFV